MQVSPEILELSHRLLYRPDLLRKFKGEDPLGHLSALRSECKVEIPSAATLRSQARVCAEQGISALLPGCADYPHALTVLPDPPPVLFHRGGHLASTPRLAMVGSRRASRSGLGFARALAAKLAGMGFEIVSGLARGIDQAAHLGALEEGRTIAVMGCGLDRIYPPEASALARRINERGYLLSEFPPGIAPLPHHFPRRNRLIAALGLALVVVEARERSGALHTCRHALDLGREVFVVPGSPTNPSCRGSNRLLAEGAKLLMDPDDLLSAFGLADNESASQPWTPERCGQEGIKDVETLARRAGWPLTEALETLAEWEASGLVLRGKGGEFSLVESEAVDAR